MNTYQENKLKERIRSSFPIRNKFISPSEKEIKKLYDLSILVGETSMKNSLKNYLIDNGQESRYNDCLNWINSFK